MDQRTPIARTLAAAVIAGLVASLAACGPVLTDPTPPALVRSDEALARSAAYRLQPGDQIEIHHLIDTDYTALVTVRPDGRIAVPGLADDVRAAGLSATELASVLAPLYRSQARIASPDFSVLLRSSASQQVFVGGEVARPGFLELPGGPRRIMQVLMAAGWLLPTARRHEIIVVRDGIDGGQIIFSVDLARVESGQDLAQNVIVRPQDAVLVPRSDVASFDKFIDQYVRQALPTSTSAGVFYQFNNPASAAQSVVK